MRFEPFVPQEMFRQLERMERLDELAPKMLEAGAAPVVESIRKRVDAHTRTGALANSVRPGRVVKSKRTGSFSLPVRFWGYDKSRKPTPGYPRGVPNAVKAAGLEYGNAHQAAEPFIQAAVNEAANTAATAMQGVFEEALK